MSRLGDSRLVFGVDDEVWGYVQNLTEKEGLQKVAAPNGDGNTVGVEYYNIGEKSVSGSYFFLSDQLTGPVSIVGDTTGCSITDVTGTIYIESASKARAVGQWIVIDFEGMYYPHLVNS